WDSYQRSTHAPVQGFAYSPSQPATTASPRARYAQLCLLDRRRLHEWANGRSLELSSWSHADQRLGSFRPENANCSKHTKLLSPHLYKVAHTTLRKWRTVPERTQARRSASYARANDS